MLTYVPHRAVRISVIILAIVLIHCSDISRYSRQITHPSDQERTREREWEAVHAAQSLWQQSHLARRSKREL